ncbi:hypothetical protein L3Q82_001652 [Scortum barcoo]|uniref:Uncharacterized protein n=1 Tax=Scortum barcoo TaxID=214431 RepID=A0ACB8W430_9TELE|nr:hypothetical protein L3Q82_001652 [Scortum barcoo]
MSGDSKSRGFSESLVLDDSEKGVVITGITDDKIAAKSGLQAGDEIVAATIHLDHLNKNEVLNILKILEPYDDNMKVLTKKELNASAGLGSLGLGLNDPAKILNIQKDLSLDASAEAPVVSLDGLGGKLNATKGLGGEISGPTFNGNLPSLNMPSANAGAKFTMPSVGKTGPDINAPDVSVSTPKLNTPSASLDIKKPEIQTDNLKCKTPAFTMPQFNLPKIKTPNSEMKGSGDVDLPSVRGNLEKPDLNLSAPKLDLKGPDLGLNGPKVDLNSPDVNLEAQNADIDISAQSGKIKWPHLKWKGPKVKGPDVDLNADPDVNFSTPKIDGNLSAPDVDINLPKTDIKAPNFDMDEESGKINWPHLKWKKGKLQSPSADLDLGASLNTPDVDLSVPKLEGGINSPGVDINLPKADLKGGDLDLQTPNLDAEAPSSKINWPHLKWKKQRPKADIDGDLNLQAPKFEGDMNVPNAELNVPKVDLKGSNVDVQSPDLDIDSGKINWPHLKWKKTKMNGPNMDPNADLGTPDINGSVDGKISTPDADFNLPKADVVVKAPNVDAEAPSGKFKWFTLKKKNLSVSGPKVNGQDVNLDADVSAPDLSLSAPKTDGEINVNLKSPKADLDGPKLDINAPDVEGPSGKFKWLPKFGTLKHPKVDIDADVKEPNIDLKAPDVDLSAQDVNLSVPKIKGGIEAPDLNIRMPNADVKGPDVDLEGPDLNLDSTDGKLKFPKLKLPKLKGLKVKGQELDAPDASLDLPKVGLDAPNVDVPDLSLSAPKIEGGLDVPDLDINSKADLKGPDVDLQAPEVDASAGKFKLPKINLPKFGISGPRVKEPNLNVDADLKSPHLDLSLPDVDAKLPKADLTAPDLSAPKIRGGIAASDLKLSAPDVDIDAQLPDAKLKTPKVRVPNLDRDADLKTNIDLSADNANFSLPDFSLSNPNINGPDVDLNLQKADVKGPGLDLPKAGFRVPDLNLKAPKAELQAPEASLNTPNVDINLSKADLKGSDAKLKTADVNFDSPLGDFKLPHFKLPKLGLSSPEAEIPSVHPLVEAGIEAPKANIGTPTADADISVPKLEGAIQGPEIDVKAPNVDANLEKSKLPHFKLPKFSGPNIKAPGINANADLEVSPDVKVKAPTVEGQISSPDVSVSAPEVKTSLNTQEVGITSEAELKDSPKSKLRWPFKRRFKSRTDEEGSGVDTETEVSNAEAEVPTFKFHRLPMDSLNSIGGIGDALGLSKLDTEAKDYVVSKGIRLPVVNATSKAGEKIDIMERLKMAKEKVPALSVLSTDAKTDIDVKLAAPSLDVGASTEAGDSSLMRGGTFKVEKPESVLGLVAPEITTDENDKLSLSLSNMLGLNIKDSEDD